MAVRSIRSARKSSPSIHSLVDWARGMPRGHRPDGVGRHGERAPAEEPADEGPRSRSIQETETPARAKPCPRSFPTPSYKAHGAHWPTTASSRACLVREYCGIRGGVRGFAIDARRIRGAPGAAYSTDGYPSITITPAYIHGSRTSKSVSAGSSVSPRHALQVEVCRDGAGAKTGSSPSIRTLRSRAWAWGRASNPTPGPWRSSLG